MIIADWELADILCISCAKITPCVISTPGGTLIFSYIRRLGSFLGFKILNFNIFWGFLKYEYFWGVKILWIFFGGHYKIGLY